MIRRGRPAGSAALQMEIAQTQSVDQVFGEGGMFAKHFVGYKPRSGQIKFARAVADILEKHGILLAEAGTGVGKSFGYLVPAIQAAVMRGGKIVVATANIALQEQLVKKDLPTLQRVLGPENHFEFALSKGFANYLCKDALDTCDTERIMGKRLDDPRAQAQLEAVIKWETGTGDLSEFETELMPEVRRLVTIQTDECVGRKCNHYKECYPRAARKKCGGATVIVTNYHLYFLDLVLKMSGAKGILPEHDALICDEAHAMAEIARSFLGVRCSEGSIKSAVEDLNARGRRQEKLELPRGIDPELREEAVHTARELFQELLELRRSVRYKARINRPNMFVADRMVDILGRVARKYLEAASQEDVKDLARDWLRGRAELAHKLAGVLVAAVEYKERSNIYYLDEDRDRVTLVCEPIHPGDILRNNLWECDANPRSFVLCSATMTTGSEGFEYIAAQLGIRKYVTCEAESPFDYTRAGFVVPNPDTFPEPSDPKFAHAVGEALIETVKMARGRTLGLFTSRRVLDVAHRMLLDAKLPYPVLRQDELPRSKLLARFKAEPETVLLGVESFWTGVDVSGDSLVTVFIDKIPFDHFEDPLLDAIKTSDENWFKGYYLPRAVIMFKQGFGRLIRDLRDYGVVVCCDRRIALKGYGRSFSRAVPRGVHHSFKLGHVEAKLAKHRGMDSASTQETQI